MTKKYEPLKQSFIAEPPLDQAVMLINILVRQIEVGEQRKQEVLDACNFVIDRYDTKSKGGQ